MTNDTAADAFVAISVAFPGPTAACAPQRAGEFAEPASGTHGADDADDAWAESLGELVVALYRQGRSARDVSFLVETMTADEVNKVVRAAGIARRPAEAARLASQRIVARNAIIRTDPADLTGLAERWKAGEEVEVLAAERAWPPDLLWDALADTLSATSAPDPADGHSSAVDQVDCVGVCRFRCAARCALTTGNPELRLPGEPAITKRPGRHEGVRYARTGLDLPAPGPYSHWGP